MATSSPRTTRRDCVVTVDHPICSVCLHGRGGRNSPATLGASVLYEALDVEVVARTVTQRQGQLNSLILESLRVLRKNQILLRVVAFLPAPGMFIFTKRFSVTPTRNHDHSQLVDITPTDDRVKGVS